MLIVIPRKRRAGYPSAKVLLISAVSPARSHELIKYVLSVQMENVEEMSTTHSMWIKIKEPLTDILRGKQTKASAAFAALKGPDPLLPPVCQGEGFCVTKSKHGCKFSWMSRMTPFLV